MYILSVLFKEIINIGAMMLRMDIPGTQNKTWTNSGTEEENVHRWEAMNVFCAHRVVGIHDVGEPDVRYASRTH